MDRLQLAVDESRLADVCRRYKVRELALFGSVLRDDFTPTSDVDVLVQFEPGSPVRSLFDFSRVKQDQRAPCEENGVCQRHARRLRQGRTGMCGGSTGRPSRNDELTQDAVIRQPEIIGEAGARVSAGFQALTADIPWRLIKDLRNGLIHGYASVRLNLVWMIASEDVPTLRKQLADLLGREIGPGANL